MTRTRTATLIIAVLLLAAGSATPCLAQQRQVPLVAPAAAALVLDGEETPRAGKLRWSASDLPERPADRTRTYSRDRLALYSLGGIVAGGLIGYSAHRLTIPSEAECNEENGLYERCEMRTFEFTLSGAAIGGFIGAVSGWLLRRASEPGAALDTSGR